MTSDKLQCDFVMNCFKKFFFMLNVCVVEGNKQLIDFPDIVFLFEALQPFSGLIKEICEEFEIGGRDKEKKDKEFFKKLIRNLISDYKLQADGG